MLIQASQMVEEYPIAGPSEVIPPAVPQRFGSPQRNDSMKSSCLKKLVSWRTLEKQRNGLKTCGSYKRVCEQQQQLTSDILNGKKKKQNEEPVDENDSSIVNVMSSSQSSVHHQEKIYDYKQAIPFTLNISSSNVTFNITHSSN